MRPLFIWETADGGLEREGGFVHFQVTLPIVNSPVNPSESESSVLTDGVYRLTGRCSHCLKEEALEILLLRNMLLCANSNRVSVIIFLYKLWGGGI